MASPRSIETSTPFASYEEAVDYLFGRINYERVPTSKYSNADFQLKKMAALLERLGNPQTRIPAVHITGTKGKGSTAAMTAAILRAAGFRVGLFTSPHLEHFEERMTVNSELPSRFQVLEITARLRSLTLDLEENDSTRPTFFELSTALAWMVFEAQQCDVVVLEVGLGGRLDTTNLCHPLVTVITSVSRDHMRLLGDSLELIAAEKAGIVKPGVPCLTGVTQPSVHAVIESACHAKGAPLWTLGQEICIRNLQEAIRDDGLPRWSMQLQTPTRLIDHVDVPLAGEFQTRNAALAITAADLAVRGFSLPESHRFPSPITSEQLTDEVIRSGIAQVQWPLRMEVAGRAPLVILDAAHNDASMQELCRAVQSVPCRRRTLIFGTSKDKEAAVMLRIASKGFDQIILTRYSTNPRGWPIVELLQLARQNVAVPVRTCDTVHEAIQIAREWSQPDDLICVAGSFFLAAEARNILKP